MAFPRVRAIKDELTGPSAIEDLEKYIYNQVSYLLAKTDNLRTNLLPKWVDIYKAKPDVERKSFPWPSASNLVVPLAATHADELLSRIMSIYQSDQLFIAKILGDFAKGEGEDQRDMIEHFMADVSLDPNELDLYRVEEVVFASAGRYGTGIATFPWIYNKEQVYTGNASSGFEEKTLSDNPRPENVPLNRFLVDPQTSTLRNAKFFSHIVPYTKADLRDLIEREAGSHIFDTTLLRELMDGSPDRDGPDYMQAAQEESKGMANNWANVGAQWDIHQCWFSWWINGKKYRIVAHWHHGKKKIVGGIFNPYPDNEAPYEDAKLAYDDDQYYGYGFMEMLEVFQREVSQNHNQRVDNRDLSNTGVLRVNIGSSLASVIQVYPGAVIPATEGEFELMTLGAPGSSLSSEDEQLTLALAKDRSGVDPAVGGAGGGIVNSKRGQYSAQGTAIAMQQSNNRNNLRLSDMRSAHVRMGRKILQQYATYGIERKTISYGDKAKILKLALENFRSGKLGLVIKPATASNNKELEKQNNLLLLSTMERIQQMDQQSVQGMSQNGIPPELKSYMIECLIAKNTMLRRILRDFEHSDVERLAPVPDFITQYREEQNAAANGTGKPVAQTNGQPQLTQGAVPNSGRGAASGIPEVPATNTPQGMLQ